MKLISCPNCNCGSIQPVGKDYAGPKAFTVIQSKYGVGYIVFFQCGVVEKFSTYKT